MVNGMQGTPQQPVPSKPGLHIPVRIRMDPSVEVDMPELRTQRKEDMPKGAYMKKRDFEKFVCTEDCEGCRSCPGDRTSSVAGGGYTRS